MNKFKEIMEIVEDNNCTNIYFDLDGVLADFEKAKDKIMKDSGYEDVEMNNDSKYLNGVALEAKNYMWKMVYSEKDFYGDLEVLEEGYKIFEEMKKNYNVKILSAVPKKFPEKASEQKRRWCKKYLGDVDVLIVANDDKNQVVDVTNALLIDDREKNIEKWIKAGGIGYLYK